jgi:predicted kinase
MAHAVSHPVRATDTVPAHPRLSVRPRELVVLAGLPGAGKTTLLRRLATDDADTVVLDPEQVAARLSAVVPFAPYRSYRFLVHAAHWGRVAAAVLRTPRAVIVHDTGTRRRQRGMLAALGRVSGRPTRLIWLAVAPDVARAGQRQRGRWLPSAAFAAHVRRGGHLAAAIEAGRRPRGWDRVDVIGRSWAGDAA